MQAGIQAGLQAVGRKIANDMKNGTLFKTSVNREINKLSQVVRQQDLDVLLTAWRHKKMNDHQKRSFEKLAEGIKTTSIRARGNPSVKELQQYVDKTNELVEAVMRNHPELNTILNHKLQKKTMFGKPRYSDATRAKIHMIKDRIARHEAIPNAITTSYTMIENKIREGEIAPGAAQKSIDDLEKLLKMWDGGYARFIQLSKSRHEPDWSKSRAKKTLETLIQDKNIPERLIKKMERSIADLEGRFKRMNRLDEISKSNDAMLKVKQRAKSLYDGLTSKDQVTLADINRHINEMEQLIKRTQNVKLRVQQRPPPYSLRAEE